MLNCGSPPAIPLILLQFSIYKVRLLLLLFTHLRGQLAPTLVGMIRKIRHFHAMEPSWPGHCARFQRRFQTRFHRWFQTRFQRLFQRSCFVRGFRGGFRGGFRRFQSVWNHPPGFIPLKKFYAKYLNVLRPGELRSFPVLGWDYPQMRGELWWSPSGYRLF